MAKVHLTEQEHILRTAFMKLSPAEQALVISHAYGLLANNFQAAEDREKGE